MLGSVQNHRHDKTTVTIDELVPRDHFLRAVDALIDFSFIERITTLYYCADNGRPSIAPVTLFKMLFLKEADMAQDKGDIAKAIRAYSKLIEMNCYSATDVSNFYEFRADLTFKEYDDRESAFSDLNHSIVNNPLNDRSIAKQGILWYLLNDFKKAETSAQNALDLNPTNETALMLLDWLNNNQEMQN